MNIGDHIRTLAEFESLPLGSKLGAYFVMDDGVFDTNGNVWNLQAIAGSDRLDSIGTIERPAFTLAEMHQRFRTISLGRAHQSGVDRGPVLRAFRALQVPDFALHEGMWWHPQDQETRLPSGTVLSYGFPEQGEFYLATYIAHSGLSHLLGPWRRMTSGCLRVVSFPEGTTTVPWPVHEGDQAALIADFKHRAWQVGSRAKSSSSWCGDFEQAMFRVGIDHTALDLPTLAQAAVAAPASAALPTDLPADLPRTGGVVNDQATKQRYPEGAAFGYEMGSRTGWNITVRRMEGGMHGTEHLVGPNGGRYGGANSVVLWDGTGEPLIAVHSVEQMRQMPHMTIARYTNSTNERYWVKGADDEWHRNDGDSIRTSTRMLESRNQEHLRYCYIPGDRGVDFGRVPYQVPVEAPVATPTMARVPYGTRLTSYADQRDRLPEGAVTYWPDVEPSQRVDADNWCLIMRDNSGHQRTSVNLVGPNSGGHSSHLRVAWDGQGQMDIPVLSIAELDRMMEGTVVQYAVTDRVIERERYWTKTGPSQWTITAEPRYFERYAATRTSAEMLDTDRKRANLQYRYIVGREGRTAGAIPPSSYAAGATTTPGPNLTAVGEIASPADQARMPYGTIFSGRDGQNFYVRTDGGSRTQRLFSLDMGSSAQHGTEFTVVHVGNGTLDGAVDWVVPSHAVMRAVPFGTIITQTATSVADMHWIKDGADRWTPHNGSSGIRGESARFSLTGPDITRFAFTHIPMDRLGQPQRTILSDPTNNDF